jgi:hypothetical protein
MALVKRLLKQQGLLKPGLIFRPFESRRLKKTAKGSQEDDTNPWPPLYREFHSSYS